MLLGIICCSVLLVLVAHYGTSALRSFSVVTAFLLSNSFLEYSTSGLENSLTFLLMGLLLLLARDVQSRRSVAADVTIGIVAALCLINRLDTALIVLPVALAVTVNMHSIRRVLCSMTGAIIPLTMWVVSTVRYYGVLLPNTFLAKTNVEIERHALVLQGVRYLGNAWKYDPIGMLSFCVASVVLIAVGSLVSRAAVAGCVAYVSYVMWIGGDFMAGRFFSTVIVTALVALALDSGSSIEALFARVPSPHVLAGISIGVVAVLAIGWSDVTHLYDRATSNSQMRWGYDSNHGISDERGFYMTYRQGLWQYLSDGVHAPAQTPNERDPLSSLSVPLSGLQWVASRWNSQQVEPMVGSKRVGLMCGSLGRVGIYTGPSAHWIDPCGLTDRFVASLKYTPNEGEQWRIGHFSRELPTGYVDAVATGDAAHVSNPQLRARLLKVWETIHR